MNIPDGIFKSGEKAIFSLRSLYRQYGYMQYKMSKFEEYDLYVGNKNFLVSDNVITFNDIDGKLMALKPDVTLSIVHNSPEHIKGVRKLCYNENVYRVPKGGISYKEIMQTGLECIGEVDEYLVAESITLAVKSLALISDDFALDVSHLGLLSKALELTGVSDEAKKRLVACVAAKNVNGVASVCATEGVKAENAKALIALVSSRGTPEKVLAELRGVFKDEESLAMIDSTGRILSAVPCGNINIDFSVTGDMNYYNGIVFKGFVNSLPSALLSGGQYDNLMRRMGKRSRAVGFALYLDLLESLTGEPEEFDVDTALVYPEGTPASAVAKAAERLIESGAEVTVLPSVPEKLRCRRIIKLNGDGEIIV
ncbi:MAG: ATP phosphoribosyltransferase regulatory subunit [Clostridia bacterium]|nr:ATP phosphoribosyltransferase regulatory subunit [Clostridia bacterium]